MCNGDEPCPRGALPASLDATQDAQAQTPDTGFGTALFGFLTKMQSAATMLDGHLCGPELQARFGNARRRLLETHSGVEAIEASGGALYFEHLGQNGFAALAHAGMVLSMRLRWHQPLVPVGRALAVPPWQR